MLAWFVGIEPFTEARRRRRARELQEEVALVKFTILLRRNAAMTHDAFVAHHRGSHAALFMSVAAVQAHVRRYVQQHALPVDLPGLPPNKYDGITELWFDDVEGIAKVFGDPEYLARIRPDEQRFLDLHGCDFVVSRETEVAR